MGRLPNAQTLAMAGAELDAVVAPELAQFAGKQRHELRESLHAISIWAFWESLRTELGLDPEQAENLVRSTVTALLAEAGFR